jgi:NAD(P)-dependent dehydrogenase (short-subunit alcohol dehydrogenase family)
MTTSLRFDGQVALVTGAAGGLGRAHALELARRGAAVVLNDIARDPDGTVRADVVRDEIRSTGGEAIVVIGDVGVEEQAVGLVHQSIASFGRLDVLVNNAGHGLASRSYDTPTTEFRNILDVHLFGTFWTQREALIHMRERGYGRIVNTGSAVGVFGAPNTLAYSAAKGAIHALTRTASLENRDHDIAINAIAPVANSPLAAAYFATQAQLETSRLDPAYCSPVVAYLAHPTCSLSGQLIATGGGRVARIATGATPGLADPNLDSESIAEHLDAVMALEGFRVLGSSVEQYQLMPTFDPSGTRS